MGRYSNQRWALDRLNGITALTPRPRKAGRRSIKRSQRHLSGDDRHTLVEAYRAGATQAELSIEFGVHRNTVSTILGRERVVVRQLRLTGDEVAAAARLYNDGHSLASVGAELGVDAEAVRQHLIRLGTPIRPRRGWKYPPET